MSENSRTSARAGIRVVAWVISSYFSAILIIGLACLFCIPFAWLSDVLGLQSREFLILSAVPLLVSVYAIQRHRVGERASETVVASVFKQKTDISQIGQIYAVESIWSNVKRLAEERVAYWHNLVELVRHARQETSKFDRAVAEQFRVLERLVHLTASTGTVSASTADVQRTVSLEKELTGRIEHLEGEIFAYNEQIVEEAASLFRRADEQQIRQAAWHELRTRLNNAEKLLVPTLWTRLEFLGRGLRISANDRSYQQKRAYAVEWLEHPFDPSPVWHRRSELLYQLEGERTIHCRDGNMVLHLEVREPEPRAVSYLPSETIDVLGNS